MVANSCIDYRGTYPVNSTFTTKSTNIDRMVSSEQRSQRSKFSVLHGIVKTSVGMSVLVPHHITS